MNIKEIKQLLSLIKEYDVGEFELEREGVKIAVRKNSGQTVTTSIPMPMYHPMQDMGMPRPAQVAAAASAAEEKIVETKTNIKTIVSPIVGTFYTAPSPDAAPYASVGQKIGPNDTVCIIEAMKVMNEIKAEMSGVIEEVMVQNGQAVEFGQVLFKVRPN